MPFGRAWARAVFQALGVVWLIVGLQAGDDVGGFLPDNGFMVWVVPVEITVGRSLG
jgi:hypothetical protein